jgi:carbamoyltransferase
MKILGIKLTHDGAIALIDNGKLIFSFEAEKLNNNPRFQGFNFDTVEINDILDQFGYTLDDVDKIVIDGWCNPDFTTTYIEGVNLGKGEFTLELMEYGSLIKNENILDYKEFDYSKNGLVYNGYRHIAGHVFSAYCTSDFSKEKKSSYILVWDGGICPQLFYFDFNTKSTKNLGPLFYLAGQAYGEFARKFYPFNNKPYGDLSIAGKAMAYIAMGSKSDKLLHEFNKLYKKNHELCKEATAEFIVKQTDLFIDELAEYATNNKFKPEDIMLTFHHFLEDMLVSSLSEKIKTDSEIEKNICLSGGCALNIKWNSAIRSMEIIGSVYVPPFPNDSGSAIGIACCEMINQTGNYHLDWNVYSGPQIVINKDIPWKKIDFSIEDLAYLLHHYSEPIVVLNDRAEMGPRALGNRSILAPTTSLKMKDLLNKIKKRENYRPVAPICMEEDAKEMFIPGIKDPFMLFDHMVKDEWLDKIPAIVHLDNTARLQTVNEKENRIIYEILTQYKKLSGLPILCNTSANFNGSGFFPDINSAIEWGGTHFVWNNNEIYYDESVAGHIMNIKQANSLDMDNEILKKVEFNL